MSNKKTRRDDGSVGAILQVYLSVEEKEKLKKLAYEKGVSMSLIVSEMIKKKLDRAFK